VGEVLKELSVVMTVYNREPEVLLAVLRSLWRSVPQGTQLVIVDDGSTIDYAFARGYISNHFEDAIWHRIDLYEAYRIAGGYNNPARAFNAAVDLARHERLIIMSSDVLANPKVFARLHAYEPREAIYTPAVIDTESGMQYCGPQRVFPMPWLLGTSKSLTAEVGGWDELYLKGLCYEDNDFIGRLALACGQIIGDWNNIVYHISHDQPAYVVTDHDVAAANERNRKHTLARWKGIPFDRDCSPFDVMRAMHPSGDIAYNCIDRNGILTKIIESVRAGKATA